MFRGSSRYFYACFGLGDISNEYKAIVGFGFRHPESRASFWIEWENRRVCLNRVKPLKSPQPELLN